MDDLNRSYRILSHNDESQLLMTSSNYTLIVGPTVDIDSSADD